MIDNIQKLYEITGVDSVGFNTYTLKDEYPPFTVEKQLELIKWLALDFKQNSILHIDRWTSGKVRFGLDKEKYTEPYYELDYAYGDKDFSQALAGLILQLWNELSDTQKDEIKEILE